MGTDARADLSYARCASRARSMSEVSGFTPGYVFKRSTWLKAWRNRYFFVTGTILFFAGREGLEHHDSINVEHATCYMSVVDSSRGSWFTFEIISKNRRRRCHLRTQDSVIQKRLVTFIGTHATIVRKSGGIITSTPNVKSGQKHRNSDVKKGTSSQMFGVFEENPQLMWAFPTSVAILASFALPDYVFFIALVAMVLSMCFWDLCAKTYFNL